MRQRSDVWALRVYVGRDPVTGHKKTLTRTFRGGMRKAEEALSRLGPEVAALALRKLGFPGFRLVCTHFSIVARLHHRLRPSKPSGTGMVPR